MKGRCRRIVTSGMVALALFIVACGDESTAPAAGPPAALSIVDGDDQTGPVGSELPEALVVRVVDAQGRPVKGVVLNFRVTSGGGTVFGGSSSTNADGEARERWTLGTVAGEPQLLEVRAVDNTTGEPLVFGSFTATAVSGPATALRILTSPDASIRSGVAMTPTAAVELLDRYGNVAKQSGVSVDVALAPSPETRSLLGATSTVTDAMGIAAFSGLAVVGPSGQVVLRFSSSGLTSVSTGALTLGAGQPARVAAAGAVALSGTAGEALTTLPRVIVTDLSNNPVAGVDVAFAVSTGGGVITPAIVSTDASGVAALTSWMLPNLVGSYTVTATVGAIPNGSVLFTASVRAGTATRITTVSAPNHTVTAGSSLALVVRVADAFNNPVEGATVAWTTQGGSVAAATSASNAAGEATVIATAPTSVAVVQRVTAALANGASVEFTISAVAASPDRLERVAGVVATSPAGTPVAIAPAVRLMDAFGNPIAGAAVSFAVTRGDGTITGGSATTDASGVARVGSWTLGPLDATENTLAATAGAETVSFTTMSTTPIGIGFTSPAARQAVGNTLAVSVSATTSATGGAIASVVANVGDRQTSLSAAAGGSSTWTGELSLQGLPTGEHYFRVTATDRDGNVRRDSVLVFLNDGVPTLTVTSPLHGSVVSGSVALRASCQDDSPNCTVEVSGDFSATGTGSIDIPAFSVPDGTSKVLVFTARDGAGHAVSETRRVFGESSARLTRVDSAPGGILDVDAGRILYTAGAFVPADRGTPGILNRSTRQNELMTGNLIAPRSRIRGDAYLAPNVAILKVGGTIKEWRSGLLTTLASTSADLVVKGDYALWGEFAGLRRRNLATQQTEAVNGPAPNSAFIYDVGPNGAVAYKTTNNIVVFVLPGSPGYSCCGDFVRAEFPLTDGETTVHSWSRIVHTDGYTLLKTTATSSIALGPETAGSSQTWYRDYQVNAGWVAYAPKPPYAPTVTNAPTALYVRSPAGVTTTIATGSFAIESLAPNGTVVFSNGSDRFVGVVNGGSATVTRISAAHGYVYWVENALFVAIGNTLFQANY